MSLVWYRMLDAAPRGVFETRPTEADSWNRKGFGIFWAVNAFNGPRRIENLTAVKAWAVDMDAGTKAEQRARINRSPLVPSLVVETKRGYQVYFNAKDGTAERWNEILVRRLVPFFGADSNARDLARILRVPGFLHLKNPAEPFLVRIELEWEVSYTETQIISAFPDASVEAKEQHEQAKLEWRVEGDGFWDRVWNLDCEEGLRRLESVLGETYEFRQNRNGKKNILVNGKSSSCFLDKHGRIGSLSGGGPTLYQWVKWFGHSPKQAVEILKRTFPELEVPREHRRAG